MAQRSVGRSRFPSRRPSLKDWAGLGLDSTFNALAAASSVIVGNFTGLSDVTILRIRGLLSIGSDQTAAGGEVHGALGVAIVSEEAFTIGITAVPLPITNDSSDLWMLWQPFSHGIQRLTSVGFAEPRLSNWVVDSKAMRKMSNDQRAVVVLQNSAATAGLIWHLDLRSLARTGAGG